MKKSINSVNNSKPYDTKKDIRGQKTYSTFLGADN